MRLHLTGRNHHANPPHRRAHCVKKRDPLGKDEIDIYVSVDGGPQLFISGPHFLDKSNNDDFVDLHTDRNSTDEIKVRLKERDAGRGGNNDKDLGSKTYEKTELKVAMHDLRF